MGGRHNSLSLVCVCVCVYARACVHYQGEQCSVQLEEEQRKTDKQPGLQYLVINDQAPLGVIDFYYTHSSAAFTYVCLVSVEAWTL